MGKKIFCLVVFLAFGFIGVAAAHPPGKVALEFDRPTHTLTATIMHSVLDPSRHYVFKIHVLVNDVIKSEQTLSVQSDRDQEKVSYVLPDVRVGDKISVEAYCNLSGVAGDTIKVR